MNASVQKKKTAKGRIARPRNARRRTRPSTASFVLKIVSNPQNVTRVESFLGRVNRAAHLDDGTLYRLLVACTEAVNNAIVHGNGSDPKKSVVVTCTVLRTSVSVTVKDEGRGFDPDALPDPTDEKNLLRERGRGVFLMRKLVDHIRFASRRTGEVVTMRIQKRS